MDSSLKVKPGDPITADIWNRMLNSADRSNVLYGGENTRITKTPHGTLVNAKTIGGYLHPWRVLVSATNASIQPGLINGQTHTINSNGSDPPITDRTPPSLLAIDTNNFNNGLGWIALELETDKDPKQPSDDPIFKYTIIKTAKIIQCKVITGSELTTKNPFFYFGFPGIGNFKVRYPLARLQSVGEDQVLVFQVAIFNLNWKAKPPQPSGGGTGGTAVGSAFPRHFFWPA
jgi:hypothetical protein